MRHLHQFFCCTYSPIRTTTYAFGILVVTLLPKSFFLKLSSMLHVFTIKDFSKTNLIVLSISGYTSDRNFKTINYQWPTTNDQILISCVEYQLLEQGIYQLPITYLCISNTWDRGIIMSSFSHSQVVSNCPHGLIAYGHFQWFVYIEMASSSTSSHVALTIKMALANQSSNGDNSTKWYG